MKQENVYLITWVDGDNLEVSASNIRDLVLKLSEQVGGTTDMFITCTRAYDENDLDGLVKLYGYFHRNYSSIGRIYKIEQKIYDSNGGQPWK